MIFLSTLPVLTDYITLQGEITSPGPHLLNSACSRALLRRSNNILCSPASHNKNHVYIVIHKNRARDQNFMTSLEKCNLRLTKVMELTNTILKYCLDFTLHSYLHPSWTRLDNKYLQGSDCLYNNTWTGCVKPELSVQDKCVVLALKSALVKLLVPRLTTFHIRDEIIRMFMRKEIRTITSRDIADSTCYVLPSFKPALVHSISYDIDPKCPLKDTSDMIAYWLDYHGMYIPPDTNIFISLSFNFPGAPVLTYPYYCIRKSFLLYKPRTDTEAINEFVDKINILSSTHLSDLQISFPVTPKFCSVPNKAESKDCLVKELPKPTESNIPQKSFHNNSADDQHKQKIVPRFRPYPPARQLCKTVRLNNTETQFPKRADKLLQSKPFTSNLVQSVHKPDVSNSKPLVHKAKDQKDQNEFKATDEVKLMKVKESVNLPTAVSTKTIENNNHTFDDFEVKQPHSTKATPTSTPILTSQPKSSQSTKIKAAPKILTTEQLTGLYRSGQLTKANTASLGAFLKCKNVKGVRKLKKDQLVQEAVKILQIIQPINEH